MLLPPLLLTPVLKDFSSPPIAPGIKRQTRGFVTSVRNNTLRSRITLRISTILAHIPPYTNENYSSIREK